MSLPFGNTDTTFDHFLQELPQDYWELAIEFKAFSRARKIKSPAQLLQGVLGYCSIVTLLAERIRDTTIHRRLKACLPWAKALLERMMGAAAGPVIHGHLRFGVIDGSTVQGPGANGTWYRLHIAVDWVKLHLLHVEVTDKHQGEQGGDSSLHEGDVMGMDRGYTQAKGLIEQADQGVSAVLQYNPQSLNVWEAAGEKIDWYERLPAMAQATHCLPVQVREGGESIEGYEHACRLPPAQAAEARRRVRAAAKKKGRCVQ